MIIIIIIKIKNIKNNSLGLIRWIIINLNMQITIITATIIHHY